MALLRTLWINAIMEQLFDENPFLEKALNWDEYVTAGFKTVVIPQAGLPAGYERNRVTLPATINTRSDSDVQYDMTDYTSDPRLITQLEQKQLSYDKLASETRLMLANIKDGVALDMIYNWRAAGAGNVILTTGGSKATTLTGSTGNRKKIVFADFLNAKEVLDKAKAPQGGRIMLMPSTMYNEAMLDKDITDNFNTKVADLNKGILGEFLGFTIYNRSEVIRYDTNGAAKVPTAATAATDSHAALFWHPNFIGRSKGNVEVFADAEPRPEYYGRVISSQMQAGGRKVYADGRGVGAIVQANV